MLFPSSSPPPAMQGALPRPAQHSILSPQAEGVPPWKNGLDPDQRVLSICKGWGVPSTPTPGWSSASTPPLPYLHPTQKQAGE